MGIYRRIEVHTWVDEKFKKLSAIKPSGQGLWFYLLTGPQTGIIPGLFKAGHAAMAEDLEWELEAFEEAFREVLREGLAKDSVKDRLVWIPNAIKYNPPASPNVIRAWGAALDTLPECKLRKEAIEYMRKEIYLLDKKEVKGFAKAFDEVFGKAFPEALPKGNANPSPNQEQDSGAVSESVSKEEGEASASASPAPTSKPDPKDKTPPNQGTLGKFENVILSTKEYTDLLNDYGMDMTDDYIDRLSIGIEKKGYAYKSHYAAIVDWIAKDKAKDTPKDTRKDIQYQDHTGSGGKLDDIPDDELAAYAMPEEARKAVADGFKKKIGLPGAARAALHAV